MKILQISALFTPHIGGIETHVYTLSRYLVKKGHDVTVFTSKLPKTQNYEMIDGIKVHRFRNIWSPLNNQVVPGIFFRLLKKAEEFDLIHVHGHLQFTSNVAALNKKIGGRPLVMTSHGTVEYEDWRGIINRVYNASVGKLTVKSADKIIALTSRQAKIIEKMGARKEDITIIPNGVDLERVKLSAGKNTFKSKYGLSEKKIILYVGGLIPRKGLNYLIESMKDVNGDVALVIVGGELSSHKGVKDNLENLVKSEKLQNVVFTGNLTGQGLEDAYASADVFVLPSLAEGLAIALLEAMAYGIPVVATDIPGNSGIIQDNQNGVLVEPKNPSRLAEKINYILGNQGERERLGKNARTCIEMEYSWGGIIDKISGVYGLLV